MAVKNVNVYVVPEIKLGEEEGGGGLGLERDYTAKKKRKTRLEAFDLVLKLIKLISRCVK